MPRMSSQGRDGDSLQNSYATSAQGKRGAGADVAVATLDASVGTVLSMLPVPHNLPADTGTAKHSMCNIPVSHVPKPRVTHHTLFRNRQTHPAGYDFPNSVSHHGSGSSSHLQVHSRIAPPSIMIV